MIYGEVAKGDELAKDRPPLRLTERGADAESGQLLVAALHDLFAAIAAQNVDQMAGAKVKPTCPLRPEHT